MYAKAVKFIKSRKDLTEDRLDGLEEIIGDEAKTKAIYDASRSSMGMLVNCSIIHVVACCQENIGTKEAENIFWHTTLIPNSSKLNMFTTYGQFVALNTSNVFT